MRLYGLIGFPLLHSLSRKYFLDKFSNEGITNIDYRLFPLENLADFNKLIADFPDIKGLNVTTPYKISILPYLNKLDDTAQETGAVNTIKIITYRNKLIKVGYNTDVIAFKTTLDSFIKKGKYPALILGTGGASKAVSKVLYDNKIDYHFVSSSKSGKGIIAYDKLNKAIVQKHKLIINTTPLGMMPDIKSFPGIPYHFLTKDHFLYDLVYNPEETIFLAKGKKNGAFITNGLRMLKVQADKAWEIWNNA